MNVVLLSNPLAGGSEREQLHAAADALGDMGEVSRIEPSLEALDEEVRGAAAHADLVVVAGGDGTFNRAVNALSHLVDDVALALLPMGTGNDLARTLELPLDPVPAAVAVANGRERSIDIGRASGPGVERLFVNACMGGFPVAVDEAIDEETKRRFGAAAFLLGGAKAATELRRSTVTLDGVEVRDCVAVGVGNGRTCGGGLEVWPRARPDDGFLDGCALPASSHAMALRLAAKVKSATHHELDDVKFCRGRRVAIASEPPIEINVDGELVGLFTPATFEVARRIELRVPVVNSATG